MMRRATAAQYCDLSVPEFEREVAAGTFPMPVKLGNSLHWSRIALDDRLARLTGEKGASWRDTSDIYAA